MFSSPCVKIMMKKRMEAYQQKQEICHFHIILCLAYHILGLTLGLSDHPFKLITFSPPLYLVNSSYTAKNWRSLIHVYSVIIVIRCVNNSKYEIDLTLTKPQTSPHLYPLFSVTSPFPSSLLNLGLEWMQPWYFVWQYLYKSIS